LQYGKIGAAGTNTVKDFPDHAQATAFIAKQVRACVRGQMQRPTRGRHTLRSSHDTALHDELWCGQNDVKLQA
jgi:predicted DNA-binding WGR domain protein